MQRDSGTTEAPSGVQLCRSQGGPTRHLLVLTDAGHKQAGTRRARVSVWVTAAATIARRWVLDRKVAGAVRVRPGEGEMKCWGFLEKGNRMESTRPVQSVLRFCGQQGWPNSLRSGGSTGRARVSAPALPILPLPRIQGRLVPRHSTMRDKYTVPEYPGRVPRKGEGGDGGDGGDRSALAALNEC